VTSIEHVLVLSDDIDATRDFYCAVVGLTVGDRPPLAFPGYWLYAGTTACVHVAERGPYAAHAAGLGLNCRMTHAGSANASPDGERSPSVSERDPGVGPVDHVAFSAGDYDALVERLESCGVPAVTNVVPGGPRQVFIEDPNGVRIEINVRS
jgi:catechol 2,3-dioxygenase-like lactoylglutathione lyase family enzyme